MATARKRNTAHRPPEGWFHRHKPAASFYFAYLVVGVYDTHET